ncbi:putative magnesium transporter NIPA [Lyophyllum shimeji]|uniref:Magnesium transporter NIPA n=1 Tax=Lyophyllum shimeji TaxID=47721 RepID=A0A9P3UN60_LYOSH|nr:putative magnesium transporter NIPA [Lyophyllum shimeji]
MPTDEPPTRPPPNPVVSFIIGLSIVLLASLLNAAGLNLTKLDHVRTSAVPKSARKRDWMRPLWLLGMTLYILSQLIGSTLALEYMRAEYVAPLGSTSLIFNFLFARFLVGSPVTSTDIYGTIVVILGVIGIVAFGSINSGLSSKTDVTHITYLWRRGGWLSFFFCMAGALLTLLVFAERLDAVLASRADLSAMPTPNETPSGSRAELAVGGGGRIRETSLRPGKGGRGWWARILSVARAVLSAIRGIRRGWQSLMKWITGWLEVWTAPQDDKQVAWTLGIAWACCGGGLAGMCLVFAKATVKLLSGSLSKQNPGNQFGHAAPIFTIFLLAATAVLQILCLNRGLRIYDSTLVVPVFYGVYTASGFLDSLIFNDEVDAYQSWTLFLIFVSILVLISGVVLLTHKKPEPVGPTPVPLVRKKGKAASRKTGDEEEGRARDDEGGEQDVLWAVGEDEEESEEPAHARDEDPDVDHHQNPIQPQHRPRGSAVALLEKGEGKGKGVNWRVHSQNEEGVKLIDEDDEEEEEEDNPGDRSHHRQNGGTSHLSSPPNKPADPFKDDDEFGDWEGVAPKR